MRNFNSATVNSVCSAAADGKCSSGAAAGWLKNAAFQNPLKHLGQNVEETQAKFPLAPGGTWDG